MFWFRQKKRQSIIVLKDHNLAYVRVPKAANSSIKQALASLMVPDIDEKTLRGTTKDDFWKKHPGSDIVMLRDFRKTYPRFFCFTFVRNPYDRLVSCYQNKLQENENASQNMKRMGIEHGMPFDLFVRKVAATPDRRVDVHLRSQAGMLLDWRGRVVADYVGRVETIGDDWQALNTMLCARGMPVLRDLGLVNASRSERSELGQLYTPELRSLVHGRYRRDFALFYPEVEP
ncbi:sulfotransferase family protein [Rhizobium sp. TRM95111]|uniref:sulfotransferase family protein n=1 Tax=Rhizobium alarense TaxID=2846851 RepID=UPI001F48062C|nr:sulfotransferase family protein [Rhizobium alarense]MCF3640569.1 sulfotransferase family protein [Rhizobium alarense]